MIVLCGLPLHAQRIKKPRVPKVPSKAISLQRGLQNKIRLPVKPAVQATRFVPLKPAEIFDLSRPAAFRAPTPANNSFSGTIFKVQRNGKTEIFGAVAVHALLDEYLTPGSLGKNFQALVQMDEKITALPVEVVQLSSAKALDIALIKFRPQDEPLLRPLSLESASPSPGNFLYAQGFARNELLQEEIMLRPRTSSLGMRQASLSFSNMQARLGFCGSPVVNDKAELSGVFVGVGREPYIGFMASATHLDKLVQAYHNPGKALVEIKLQGKELLRLPVDEYVSQFELLDENQHLLWIGNTSQKMTTTPVEQALWKNPRTRYVRFTIGKTTWKEINGTWVVSTDPNFRYETVPFSPAN